VRVVDNLADEEDPTLGKLLARLVRVFDGAFHPVAEPELTGEPDRDIANGEREITLAKDVDHPSRVVGRDVILDLGLHPEALPIVRLGQRAHRMGI
jgi:hypothetical protein